VQEFLILQGTTCTRMDYLDFIQKHRETNADITVAALAHGREAGHRVRAHEDRRHGARIVVSFSDEKPAGEVPSACQVGEQGCCM